MYKLIDPDSAGKHVFTDRLATVAHRAWYAVHGRTFEWRLRYYSPLIVDSPISGHSFRIIQFDNECAETSVDCGIVAILPLQPEAARAHLDGTRSQFDFRPEDLQTHRSPTRISYHYLQSVYLDPGHKSHGAREMVSDAIWSLLRAQNCGYKSRPFVVYSEPHLPDGERLSTSKGLLDTGRRSIDNGPLHRIDSTTAPDGLVRGHLARLWPPRRCGSNAA